MEHLLHLVDHHRHSSPLNCSNQVLSSRWAREVCLKCVWCGGIAGFQNEDTCMSANSARLEAATRETYSQTWDHGEHVCGWIGLGEVLRKCAGYITALSYCRYRQSSACSCKLKQDRGPYHRRRECRLGWCRNKH
jgi:hypothetical protein